MTYDDQSYGERMEAQLGHPGDVALAGNTIPAKDVAAALKDIEIEAGILADHPDYELGLGSCSTCRLIRFIAAKRRGLGIEGEA